MKSNVILVVAVAVLGLVACKKKGCTDPKAMNYSKEAKKDDKSCKYHSHNHDHDHDHDMNMDSIHIHVHSLNEGDSVAHNSMVMIHGTIESESTIHGYKVELKNVTNNNTVVYEQSVGTHSTSLSLNHHWTNNVTVVSNFEAIITAYKNHDHSEFKTKTIQFVCKPA